MSVYYNYLSYVKLRREGKILFKPSMIYMYNQKQLDPPVEIIVGSYEIRDDVLFVFNTIMILCYELLILNNKI